jgi:cell wall assembly regulator SMI1
MNLLHSQEPNTSAGGSSANLATKTKWLMVPAVFLFCLFVPFDTFVPTVRSTRRSPSPRLSQARALEIRNETARIIESLSNRKLRNSADERAEGKLRLRPNVNDIEKIEAFVGTRLPEDLRYFLEQYDGLEQGRSYRGCHWLKRSEILKQGRDNLSIHAGYVLAPQCIPGSWYHPAFVPFEDLDGSGLGVDVFTGVIYHWDHDGGKLEKVANSFRDLLSAFDTQIADGKTPDWFELIR